MQGPILD